MNTNTTLSHSSERADVPHDSIAWNILERESDYNASRNKPDRYICFPAGSIVKMLEEYASLKVRDAKEEGYKTAVKLIADAFENMSDVKFLAPQIRNFPLPDFI